MKGKGYAFSDSLVASVLITVLVAFMRQAEKQLHTCHIKEHVHFIHASSLLNSLYSRV